MLSWCNNVFCEHFYVVPLKDGKKEAQFSKEAHFSTPNYPNWSVIISFVTCQ